MGREAKNIASAKAGKPADADGETPTIDDELKQLVKLLTLQVLQSHQNVQVACEQLIPFNGAEEDFQLFWSSYESLVLESVLPAKEKLRKLRLALLSRDDRNLLADLDDSEDSLKTAEERLKKKYQNPAMIEWRLLEQVDRVKRLFPRPTVAQWETFTNTCRSMQAKMRLCSSRIKDTILSNLFLKLNEDVRKEFLEFEDATLEDLIKLLERHSEMARRELSYKMRASCPLQEDDNRTVPSEMHFNAVDATNWSVASICPGASGEDLADGTPKTKQQGTTVNPAISRVIQKTHHLSQGNGDTGLVQPSIHVKPGTKPRTIQEEDIFCPGGERQPISVSPPRTDTHGQTTQVVTNTDALRTPTQADVFVNVTDEPADASTYDNMVRHLDAQPDQPADTPSLATKQALSKVPFNSNIARTATGSGPQSTPQQLTDGFQRQVMPTSLDDPLERTSPAGIKQSLFRREPWYFKHEWEPPPHIFQNEGEGVGSHC